VKLAQIPLFPALALFAGFFAISGCDRPEPAAPEPEPEAVTQAPAAEESAGYDIPQLPTPGFDIERYSTEVQTLASDDFEGDDGLG